MLKKNKVKDSIHYKDQNNSRKSSYVKDMLHGYVQTSSVNKVENPRPRSRRRRWDYDENYDWENGGKDYVIPVYTFYIYENKNEFKMAKTSVCIHSAKCVKNSS